MSREALYQAILQNPDSPEGYLVLADWLQAQGDVRGEYIQLTYGLEHEKNTARFLSRKMRADELLAAYESKWLGGVKTLSRVWRWGFVWSVTIDAQALETLLASEAGCLARHVELRVERGGLSNVERTAKRLASLKSLSLSWSMPEALDVPAALFDLSQVNLSSLSLHGDDCRLPGGETIGLRELIVTSRRPNPTLMPFVFRARHLTSLTLHGADNPLDLTRAAVALPELQRLELGRVQDVDMVLEQLARSPLLAQLESLTVSGQLSDVGLQIVGNAAERFQHLSQFRIDNEGRRNRRMESTVLALRTKLPALRMGQW